MCIPKTYLTNYRITGNLSVYSCSELTSLNINSFKADNVEDLSYMFYNCNNLKEMNFEAKQPINISNMFKNCLILLN